MQGPAANHTRVGRFPQVAKRITTKADQVPPSVQSTIQFGKFGFGNEPTLLAACSSDIQICNAVASAVGQGRDFSQSQQTAVGSH